jgi:hypothetical protein
MTTKIYVSTNFTGMHILAFFKTIQQKLFQYFFFNKNPVPGLGQAQKWDGIRLVNGILTLTL